MRLSFATNALEFNCQVGKANNVSTFIAILLIDGDVEVGASLSKALIKSKKV